MLSAVLLHKCSIVHLLPYKKYVCPEREKERKRERKRERERERDGERETERQRETERVREREIGSLKREQLLYYNVISVVSKRKFSIWSKRTLKGLFSLNQEYITV